MKKVEIKKFKSNFLAVKRECYSISKKFQEHYLPGFYHVTVLNIYNDTFHIGFAKTDENYNYFDIELTFSLDVLAGEDLNKTIESMRDRAVNSLRYQVKPLNEAIKLLSYED